MQTILQPLNNRINVVDVNINQDKNILTSPETKTEHYNKPITVEKLRQYLQKTLDTSVGPNDVHYQLLKRLPDSSILDLLNVFNDIWAS